VKLSGAAAARLPQFVREARPGFRVFSGKDSAIAATVRAGGAGVVSGVSAALPEPFTELIATLPADANPPADRPGHATTADLPSNAAADRVTQAVKLLGPSIGRLKYALEVRGLAGTASRMAVSPPGPATRAAITELLTGATAPRSVS
jgi:4-hydroxy-tetrahydrodipicolinate synthase